MTADATLAPSAPGVARRAAGRIRTFLGGTLAGWRLPAVITLSGGILRFARLGYPPGIVPLDETYYAPNAFGYLCHGTDMAFRMADSPHTCAGLAPTFAVHPPIGKLLIAGGIKLFGYDAFGWRFAAALFGTLSILVIYLIARRLWASRAWAAAAAILLGVDGLQFVQSRLAMLDIFQSFFILLGIWLLLEDRERTPRRFRPRWWRLGAGAALGLAIATKWSAVFLLPVVLGVGFAWEVVRWQEGRARARRSVTESAEPAPEPIAEGPPAEERPGFPTRLLRGLVAPVRWVWRTDPARQVFALTGTFALLPILIYVASYTSWFLSTQRFVPPRCYETYAVEGVPQSRPKAGAELWLCNQREIYDYHQHLKARNADGTPIHPYMSQAWSWPWISRPAAHYFEARCFPGRTLEPCKEGQTLKDEEILGLPNPVTWWAAFFFGLPACIWWMVRKRDATAALLVVLLAPLVLPWFITSRPLFMFYMTPAVPILVLLWVHAMHKWGWRAAAVASVVLAVGAFAYFYPILAAVRIPPTGTFGWQNHIWFGHVRIGDKVLGDCVAKGIKLLCWI